MLAQLPLRILATLAPAISQPVASHSPTAVTASIGVFSFQGADGLTAIKFVDTIDRALLQAKSLGKNQIFYLR